MLALFTPASPRCRYYSLAVPLPSPEAVVVRTPLLAISPHIPKPLGPLVPRCTPHTCSPQQMPQGAPNICNADAANQILHHCSPLQLMVASSTHCVEQRVALLSWPPSPPPSWGCSRGHTTRKGNSQPRQMNWLTINCFLS